MNFVKMTLKPQILVSIYLKVKPIDSDNTFFCFFPPIYVQKYKEVHDQRALCVDLIAKDSVNIPIGTHQVSHMSDLHEPATTLSQVCTLATQSLSI